MIAHRHFLKDIGRIFFWFPLRWCVRFIPLSAIYWMGGILGYMDYVFSGPSRAKRMEKNISRALEFNAKEARTIIINNLQNHCRNVLELMKYPKLKQEYVAKYVSFKGVQFLDRELMKGRGVILATSHFGAKQLLQVGLGLRGYKVNQLHFQMGGDDLTFIQKKVSQKQRLKIEGKIPAKFISSNRFLRPAYDCLRKNQILVIAADGVGLGKYMDRGYAPLKFLGKKMLFPINTVALARRTGAPVVPAFVIREGIKHKIVIERPVQVEADGKAFEEFIKILAKYIRRYPFLWEFWEEFEEGNLIALDK